MSPLPSAHPVCPSLRGPALLCCAVVTHPTLWAWQWLCCAVLCHVAVLCLPGLAPRLACCCSECDAKWESCSSRGLALLLLALADLPLPPPDDEWQANFSKAIRTKCSRPAGSDQIIQVMQVSFWVPLRWHLPPPPPQSPLLNLIVVTATATTAACRRLRDWQMR